MKHCLALTVSLGVLLQAAVPVSAQMIEILRAGKASPPSPTVVWGKKNKTADAFLSLTRSEKERPAKLKIGLNARQGVRLQILTGKVVEDLPSDFGSGFEGVESNGTWRTGFLIQAAEYDFDRDKKPELLILAGDNLVNLVVLVFRRNSGGKYERVGLIEGQKKIFIEGNALFLPYGSQGLFAEYRYKNGKFIEIKPQEIRE